MSAKNRKEKLIQKAINSIEKEDQYECVNCGDITNGNCICSDCGCPLCESCSDENDKCSDCANK
jgi:rubrerythrin